MLILGDRVFESTLGEGDRVSLEETTLEEGTGGVWGRQTLETRCRGPVQTHLPPLTKGCLRPLLL